MAILRNGVLFQPRTADRNNILLHCPTIVVPGLRFPATTTVEFQQHPGKEVRGGMPPVKHRALFWQFLFNILAHTGYCVGVRIK